MHEDEMLGETERLWIKTLAEEDAIPLAPHLTDPRVYEAMGGSGPENAAELQARFARSIQGAGSQYPNETWFNAAIIRKFDNEMIGRLEATILASHSEVAYLLGPVFWGQGLAYEASSWLHQYCVQQFLTTRFFITITPDNDRSLKLAAKLGYRRAEKSEWPEVLTSYDDGDLVLMMAASEIGTMPMNSLLDNNRYS